MSAAALDPTDVPFVPVADLSAALTTISQFQRSPRGLTEADLARIETALWSGAIPVANPAAVAIRIRCLAAAMTYAQIDRMARRVGAGFSEAILRASATLRLNAHRGFNPLRLAWEVEDGLDGRPPADSAEIASPSFAEAA